MLVAARRVEMIPGSIHAIARGTIRGSAVSGENTTTVRGPLDASGDTSCNPYTLF
jgi:hypothetical protein